MYCVLDIESTGGPFGKEAMMEIAVFRYDGDEVVDQLISLVHPHRRVQPFVSKMTGITEKMLARAPRFEELAKRLVQITEEAVLVGHNIDFDYRMLRQEFARLGYQFERKTLDTIKLAEELIPGLKSYGLNAICEELDIYRKNKHRAESDARATLELFEVLQHKDRQKKISAVGQGIQSNDFFKDKLRDLQRGVKHNRGVFYIHDRHGRLLYLGASDNVKAALNRLFMSENTRASELRERTQSIAVEPCGNWLVARIKKYEELQSTQPVFNEESSTSELFGVFVDEREKPPRLSVKKMAEAGRKKPLVQVDHRKAAYRAIRMLRKGQDPQLAAATLDLLRDFPLSGLYIGKGRTSGEKSLFVVEEGLCKYYRYFKLQRALEDKEKLLRNAVPIAKPAVFTDWLKLGILSGEFRPLATPTEA